MSCSDRESVARLERADLVMEEHPDSALRLLQEIDPNTLRTDKDRALYALLRTQALVKNDSVIVSDSLIRTAVDYYTAHPCTPYQMKAAYYLAEVQRNLGNLTSAVKSATQAYDLACQTDDPYWIAKSAEQLMFIYSAAFNRVESLKYARIAADNYKKSGHEINHIYSLVDICVKEMNLGLYNVALNHIDSLITILPPNTNEQLNAYCHQIRLPICIELEDYEEASNSLKELKEIESVCPLSLRVYCDEAELFRRRGKFKQAGHLLDSIKNIAVNVRDKGSIFKGFSDLYKDEGRFEEALKYKDSLMALQNAEAEKLLNSDVALSQKAYYADNYKAEEEKNKNYRVVIIEISIISLIAFFILLMVFRYIVNRKNEKIENKIKDLLILNNKLKANESERLHVLGALSDKEIETALLFKDQWATLNMLCHEYFEKGDSEKMRVSILRSVEANIKSLISPKSMKGLEKSVNRYCHDIIARLRRECYSLKETDLTFMTLLCAGLLPRTICVLMDMSLSNYYKKRKRLLERIHTSSGELADELESYLYDNQ